jgi:hypothetical protein
MGVPAMQLLVTLADLGWLHRVWKSLFVRQARSS